MFKKNKYSQDKKVKKTRTINKNVLLVKLKIRQ